MVRADPDVEVEFINHLIQTLDEESWAKVSTFIGLVEEDAVSGHGNWVRQDDIEKHIQDLDAALNPTQARSALAKDPDLIDVVAQAIPVIQAARVDVVEMNRLRAVYECARRLLRFHGVDADRTIESFNELDAAIERMKSFDAGTDPEVSPA